MNTFIYSVIEIIIGMRRIFLALLFVAIFPVVISSPSEDAANKSSEEGISKIEQLFSAQNNLNSPGCYDLNCLRSNSTNNNSDQIQESRPEYYGVMNIIRYSLTFVFSIIVFHIIEMFSTNLKKVSNSEENVSRRNDDFGYTSEGDNPDLGTSKSYYYVDFSKIHSKGEGVQAISYVFYLLFRPKGSYNTLLVCAAFLFVCAIVAGVI